MLRRRKAGGFNGPNPVEWPDIDAFLRRSGRRLYPWELNLLTAIDDAYLGAWAERDGDKPEHGTSSQPMTPALFDAVFKGKP